MRINLDRTIGWRGKTYKGDCDIPEDLAIALGITAKPPPEETHLETFPDGGQLPALVLLNSATKPIDIEPLPTIGRATAKTVFERRPEGGYSSLDAAKELNSDKAHIDWEAIALWEAE